MPFTTALRAVLATARGAITFASAVLLFIVIAANIPALLVLSFTRTGTHRTRMLIKLITTWTHTLAVPPQSALPEEAPIRGDDDQRQKQDAAA